MTGSGFKASAAKCSRCLRNSVGDGKYQILSERFFAGGADEIYKRIT